MTTLYLYSVITVVRGCNLFSNIFEVDKIRYVIKSFQIPTRLITIVGNFQVGEKITEPVNSFSFAEAFVAWLSSAPASVEAAPPSRRRRHRRRRRPLAERRCLRYCTLPPVTQIHNFTQERLKLLARQQLTIQKLLRVYWTTRMTRPAQTITMMMKVPNLSGFVLSFKSYKRSNREPILQTFSASTLELKHSDSGHETIFNQEECSNSSVK